MTLSGLQTYLTRECDPLRPRLFRLMRGARPPRASGRAERVGVGACASPVGGALLSHAAPPPHRALVSREAGAEVRLGRCRAGGGQEAGSAGFLHRPPKEL